MGMEIGKLFEKSTRKKYRYQSRFGNLTTEDLWDLKLTDLNEIAKSLNKEIKSNQEEDFLKDNSKKDSSLEDRFNIVIYILESKKAEAKKKEEARIKKDQIRKISNLMEQKKDTELSSKSIDELQAELNKLNSPDEDED